MKTTVNRTPGQQLRLFDIRVQRTELHSFGWKQQAGDTQSGYISQSWSPDGLYCASGSTDPKIHVFDIRYNSSEPVQTLEAHQKRVFKAAWHPNLPLLLSISSDLFVGMHKIFKWYLRCPCNNSLAWLVVWKHDSVSLKLLFLSTSVFFSSRFYESRLYISCVAHALRS